MNTKSHILTMPRRPAPLDPAVKEWLDAVTIPILLAELAKGTVELAA